MRALLLTACLSLPALAHAWGADGHQTVATIAAGLLQGTPAEARVTALLGGMTLQQAAVWADCAKGISPARGYSYPNPGKYAECAPLETPERIAEMADYVKRNDRQCTLAGEDSCHKQLHYSDVALQRSRYLLGFAGTREDDIVGALRHALQVLQGQPVAGPPQLRSPREALLLVAHLVGDIHQPLHVGAVYLSAQGQRLDPEKQGLDPASDTVGGNSLWVTAAPSAPSAHTHPGEPVGAGFGPVKLHSVWDGVPEKFKPARVDAAWLAEARRLPHNSGDPLAWPARWATESLDVAREAFDGMTFSPRQDRHWSVVLPEGYSARAEQIKHQQLLRAGARLAQVLQAVFPR